MTNPLSLIPVFLILTLSLTSTPADAHGTLSIPPPRGALAGKFTKSYLNLTINPNAPQYDKVHFPAGDDSTDPGAGARSQKRAASSNTWSLFNPLSPDNDWRYGVCGDLKTAQKRVKPGRFYNDAEIVGTYTAGGLIEIDISIVVHHNGFMELHVCDMSKCSDDDISEACLQTAGACRQLLRAPNAICDSQTSLDCAPIDPNYPGRWYLPCSRQKDPENDVDFYGRDAAGNPTILYQIPDDLTCEHCVLQWYWAAGDGCNPKGTREFFTNPNLAPQWNDCPGSGRARNGWVQRKDDCGFNRFAEEYVNCADIKIEPAIGDTPPDPLPSPTPSPSVSAVAAQPAGDVSVNGVHILSNGVRDTDLYERYFFDVVPDSDVTIEAEVGADVDRVRFVIDGTEVSTATERPFYIGGSQASPRWQFGQQHVNKLVEMKTIAENSRTGQSAEALSTFILLTH